MDEAHSYDDIDGLLNDTFRDIAQDERAYEGPNEDAQNFYNLVDEASQELYPGCKGFSKLSFTIPLYLLKCRHGWSNASFTSLLELLKEAIPELNILESYNKAKVVVRDLGLDYKKIDACPNDYSALESSKKPHRVPIKILRHFPLIPRLQRLFMSSKTAESLRWHDEQRSKDGKLRHPADGQTWKEFDNMHQEFAKDSRNLRLGLASDGFNPFRTMSISHNTWPVMSMVYNLPPWICMKLEYLMLSLLIPGPRSPGNDIDIYLQPLIEKLKELWEFGVETYDASRNQTFQMRSALLWTINDFPAYAMLSGWSTKGKLACPCEKNIVDSIIGTLLDISGKTKDHPNARYDLKEMGIMKSLQPKDTKDDRKVKLPTTCFSMSKGEKSIFCGVLKKAKLPDGSAYNISGCVKLAERKISNYKTHDAHFMLHYLLPIPIKSIFRDHVAIPLIRLSSFFRRLCQKVITLEELDHLELETKETLCQLERISPPSFFDIMIHLSVHLANEVRLGGPVQLRWMYSPEIQLKDITSLASYHSHLNRTTLKWL
ncbi:hypothetical protein MTR67_042561 [Solanum verrucosum]|uniref:DUF4218 domain-containing protein n=1 Tax=Solanum verrucosum TaxID=315347 RepID=A0AAF0UPK6_SOLVR|nr:hypothetical protein MTR67_042561 [Solanum verrucosum]